MKTLLPGTPVVLLTPFQLSNGAKVFDKDSNRVGRVEIRETASEWLEVFVRFDTEEKPILASKLNCVIL